MKSLPILVCLALAFGASHQQPTGCFPTNWNHRWVRVNANLWLTQLDTRRPWHEQAMKCQSIEPGNRTNFARGDTKEVQTVIAHRFDSDVWLGGFEVGNSGAWYWFGRGAHLCETQKITGSFWSSVARPDADKHSNWHCMVNRNYGSIKGWYYASCTNPKKAVCELRC